MYLLQTTAPSVKSIEQMQQLSMTKAYIRVKTKNMFMYVTMLIYFLEAVSLLTLFDKEYNGFMFKEYVTCILCSRKQYDFKHFDLPVVR